MRPVKINYPYILTHLFASMLLITGVRQFAFLMGYDIMQNLSDYGIKEVIRVTSTHEMMNLFEWLLIATFLGFYLSIIISFVILLRKRVSMVNLLIIFVINALLMCIQFLKFESVLNVRDSVGHLFRGDLLALKYVIPGTAFIILGLIVFFNPWTNRMPAKPMVQYS